MVSPYRAALPPAHCVFNFQQTVKANQKGKLNRPSTPSYPTRILSSRWQAHGADEFRTQVMDKAVPWSDWYGDRILAEHDFEGDANAFRRCTDRLTGFMSDLSIPTDQTFHVHRFAKALAGGEFVAVVAAVAVAVVVGFVVTRTYAEYIAGLCFFCAIRQLILAVVDTCHVIRMRQVLATSYTPWFFISSTKIVLSFVHDVDPVSSPLHPPPPTHGAPASFLSYL